METGAHGVVTDHATEDVELEPNNDIDLATTLHQNTVVLRAQDHLHKAETATLIHVSNVLKKRKQCFPLNIRFIVHQLSIK